MTGQHSHSWIFLNQSPGTGPRGVDRWQPLSPHRAGLWWLALADVPGHAWSRWTTLLDDEERARAARFVFERDRHQFIAAHALLRLLLQELAGGPAGAWRFIAGPHGKPALHPDHRLDRLAFNISHTRGAVACAMTLDHDIGVDIEDLGRPGRLLEIAHAYFAPDELIVLRSAPPAEQRRVFLQLWTLKEAYIKAHGDGLSLPLDRFAFTLSPPVIAFAPGFPDDPAVWQFRTLSPTASHVLSVAVRHGGTNAVAVAPQPVTPGDIDRLMAAARDDTVSAGRPMGWRL